MSPQLHPDTLKFLNELKQNNNKIWFDTNRVRYEAIKKQLLIVIDELIVELTKVYPLIAGLKASESLFRINRDIRFSKNKSPYKAHFAASITPGGKKSPHPGFYFHIEPSGNSYLGGGVYQPESTVLKAIRQEIDYNAKEYLQIVRNKHFVKTFGELYDEKISGVPRGYDKTNEMLPWLRYKSFIAGIEMKDSEVMSKHFIKLAVKHYKVLIPYLKFIERSFD